MNLELLVFGSKNFNNSIQEIKENLGYSIIFFDFLNPLSNISSSISGVIVDSQVCNDKNYLKIINKFNNKPIILIQFLGTPQQDNFDNKILLPISFQDLKNKITNTIVSSKYNSNSSIRVKDYILNKNEKKLFKLNTSISITEKEVLLIELLFMEKKSLSIDFILKKIWNYAEDADTHTVETHIYRLRKKIAKKFNDSDFILNSSKGYSL